jgi:hypothetical protein
VLAPPHPRRRLGLEAELERRGAPIAALAVGGDAIAVALEEAADGAYWHASNRAAAP